MKQFFDYHTFVQLNIIYCTKLHQEKNIIILLEQYKKYKDYIDICWSTIYEIKSKNINKNKDFVNESISCQTEICTYKCAELWTKSDNEITNYKLKLHISRTIDSV